MDEGHNSISNSTQPRTDLTSPNFYSRISHTYKSSSFVIRFPFHRLKTRPKFLCSSVRLFPREQKNFYRNSFDVSMYSTTLSTSLHSQFISLPNDHYVCVHVSTSHVSFQRNGPMRVPDRPSSFTTRAKNKRAERKRRSDQYVIHPVFAMSRPYPCRKIKAKNHGIQNNKREYVNGGVETQPTTRKQPNVW
jgi:hypothetical protein